MKKFASIKLSLLLILSLSPVGAAQPAANCDQLRSKIQRLEGMNLNSMSPSIQQVYKEALLKLYTQFGQCLQRDISATTTMQGAVAGTDAAAGVGERLRALTREKADTDGKLTVLRTALNIPDSQPAADGGAAPSAQPELDGAVAQPEAENVMPQPPAPPASGGGAMTQQEFPCLPAETYDKAPELLTDIVSKAADGVVEGDFEGTVSGTAQMLTYSTIDAASPTSSTLLRSLKAYQYLSETARTDKQLGASASSEGAVSAIEKPGFARLLGFAIEHGAIGKKNDGTNLTLSTSLYSLYTLNREDTEETYQRAGVLNRVGVFTTFAVDNKDNDLANARRKNLVEWSLKARLFGDRSTRSAKFQKFWDTEIRPLIRARLEAVGGALNVLTSGNPPYQRLRRQVGICLNAEIEKRKKEADYQAATAEGRKKILNDLLLGLLKSNVYDRIKAGQVSLSDTQITAIETKYAPGLRAALANLKSAEGELTKRLDDLNKGPLGTFAYTNHRTTTGSDYSATKFLWEQDKSFLRPLKLTGNFGLTFYHRPDSALQQEKVRDVTAALSFEGTSDSPFTEAENQSKVTYSFVGRYQRLFENRRRPDRKPDIATAQFVVEIPFLKGFSLPLSLSYSNATEEERKKNVRFNFGFRLDTDKLIELLTTTPR